MVQVDLSDAAWRKSTLSGGGGCVEVAIIGERVAVRDSKDRSGPILVFNPIEWDAFIKGVAKGEFTVAATKSDN